MPSPQLTKMTIEPEKDEDDEQSVDELIGRRKAGADGEEPTPLAHAPHFPKVSLDMWNRELLCSTLIHDMIMQNRKPAWTIFVGDHKLNRVFVQPHNFTDMGSKQVRTIRMSFQAPPGPGLYTFQVYAMNDSFIGTDAQKDLRVSSVLQLSEGRAT